MNGEERSELYKNNSRGSFLPAVALFFLAPLSAEYIIGYLDATGNPVLILGGLIIMAPLYGGPALIIREMTRRTGRGWPSIFILAFAFGLLQAGLIDHSLFDTSYEGIEDWEETMNPTLISFLGISAGNAQNFIVGHVIWSITAPIAIIEGCFPSRRGTPWLKKKELFITFIVWGLAAALIFTDTGTSPRTIQQFVGTGTIISVLLYTAFNIGKTASPLIHRKAPGSLFAGVVTFLLLSFTTILEIFLDSLSIGSEFRIGWGGVTLELLVYITLGYLIMQWSKRERWTTSHHIAIAGGALLTRAWIAFLVIPIGNVPLHAKLTHNITFLIGTIGILAIAIYRLKKYTKLSEI